MHSRPTALLLLFLFVEPVGLHAEGGRTPLRAKHGIVASASRTASDVGVDILKQGGNAIDASIATAFALAVTWPTAGNIGGGGFLVYHGIDGYATTFDFREKAPLASAETMYLGPDGKVLDNSNHDGILSIGVPGTVAGLYLAHQRLGKLPWSDLVAPSVRLASEGIPITWALQSGFANNQTHWERYPSSADVFLKSDGAAYELGDLWLQEDLAHTLELIQHGGADGFYKGENAKRLADFMRAEGGLITEEDLKRYQAIERKPIRGAYRSYEIVSMPPPSSGGVVLIEILNILEGFELKSAGHNSAQYMHLLTEAMRRGFADRAAFLGDPDFNENLPIETLTSKDHAERLRASIDLNKASPSDENQFASIYESEDTTHFSVVDHEGNMVSLTYTLEQSYGSRIVAKGGGYLLNNEMGDFNPVPGVTNRFGQIGTQPNLIEPEKRMLSSMSPTIVAQNGKPLMAIGSPGGRTIINTVLQLILNVIDHEMDIAQSIEAQRLHHQWLPDFTIMEPRAASVDTLEKYQGYGHEVRVRNIGMAMGVYHDFENGIFLGAADSRGGDAAAVGY